MTSERLDEIEAAVTAALAGSWSSEVATFKRALLALWSARGERLDAGDVRALASRLDVSPATVNAAEVLLPAAAHGDARVPGKTAVHLSPVAAEALSSARTKPRAAVTEMLMRANAADLTTLSGLLSTLAPMTRSVADMRAAASFATHTAANEAIVSAAAQAEESLVFVAERDACLECIDHSGDIGNAIEVPPLHPFCRCELQTYNDPDVPRALKREAVRSVLRGFSLPSESEAARLRAAKEMLKRRPTAPKSVLDYARRAVDKGKFGRGRGVPGAR